VDIYYEILKPKRKVVLPTHFKDKGFYFVLKTFMVSFPVGKIAEKAVSRSVFCAELTKTHSFRLFIFWRFAHWVRANFWWCQHKFLKKKFFCLRQQKMGK